ncbi:unnamed protein product [Bursaphelenchus xylophilus]|uniref:(pine wood nematode) hypothetical protein n=1 Tax=Bursaphelenchus xylophilus TaxID=6326 RepID=A0A1I7RX48_BURXY|nr:unnamed protein product [Bursaphelenchus xylophilus]CAG9121321.1 unnamed protein product [Bursaphelenchus xylophilus]
MIRKKGYFELGSERLARIVLNGIGNGGEEDQGRLKVDRDYKVDGSRILFEISSTDETTVRKTTENLVELISLSLRVVKAGLKYGGVIEKSTEIPLDLKPVFVE